LVAIILWHQECCLGKIHLPRNISHPLFVGGFPKDANGGGISRKCAVSKGIYLDDSNGHNLADYRTLERNPRN
jgi:hypothetical protein